jgi:uncharacterized protein YdaT
MRNVSAIEIATAQKLKWFYNCDYIEYNEMINYAREVCELKNWVKRKSELDTLFHHFDNEEHRKMDAEQHATTRLSEAEFNTLQKPKSIAITYWVRALIKKEILPKDFRY